MKKTIEADNTDADAVFDDPSFSAAVIAWQKQHGRHVLPWQNTHDAYRIWLSEIMLQQTQVAAVIPYYQRFLERFATVESLAAAPSEEVMALWSGLGYYSRARNLHRCAQIVAAQYGGVFPDQPALLAELPGIGRSTAAAIAAFAYGKRAAILDGNVKRVFARVFGVEGYPGAKPVEDLLWRRAVRLLPGAARATGAAELDKSDHMARYTQGLMDLGATLCTRGNPACERCPLHARCVAYATGRVDELPVRKPKKTIPERSVAMLIAVDGGEVLLQQRPDSGIWGGLLSLPEALSCNDGPSLSAVAAVAADAAAHREIAGMMSPFVLMRNDAPFQWLLPFTHTFTHFKLHVTPVKVAVTQRLRRTGEDDYVWYPIARLADAPLPAPVKKLLLEMFARVDLFSEPC